MECIVPVQPASRTASSASSAALNPTEAQLSRWRALFLPSTLPTTASAAADEFSIPPSVSEFIQTQFVARRQASASILPGATPPPSSSTSSSSSSAGKTASKSGNSVSQEDLVLRLGVARLLCASEGRKELDEETWMRTEKLDEERKGRLAAMEGGGAAMR